MLLSTMSVITRRVLAGLTPQRIESAVRLLNARSLRAASRACMRAGVRGARHLPGTAIEQWVFDSLLRPAACCPEGGPQLRFVHQYVGQLRDTGSHAVLRAHLLAGDVARAARHAESFARIVSTAMIRHELLRRFSDRPEFPPTPLIEAQIAAYPECDLSCEGCYASDDRRGHTPDRATLAWTIDQAALCGATAIHVVGKGEPFLSVARGRELLALANERPHLLFVVATHGLSLAPLLGEMSKLSNLLLLVSLDGPKEVHDARRGAGTYDRVLESMRRLREHDVPFGSSTMVSGAQWREATSEAFLTDIAERGALLAVLSRFFPLSSSSPEHLILTAEALAQIRARVERIRERSAIPILDLDEIEEHTGCRSRAGLSIHIDAATGAVSPCIRVPFAPKECAITPSGHKTLVDVLRHPYFAAYRAGAGRTLHWCGEDLAAELRSVQEQMTRHGERPFRLEQYRQRAGAVTITRLGGEAS